MNSQINFCIDAYGAVPDGQTVDTTAIQAAVDACAEAGGGRVVVFEDGELLRTVDDPDFHAHFEERQKDFELERIDKANAGS